MAGVQHAELKTGRLRRSGAAPVGVLTKVLSIFELLDRAPGGLQLRNIADQTGLNKSTAYRFLAHLERAGYLVRDLTGAYLIGPRLVHLGANSTYQATISRLSRPVMEDLWRETDETVNLGALDGTEVLYIDVLESPHHFRLSSQKGMRRAINCTALGKAVLAWLPPATRDELLAHCKFEKRTPHSITQPSELLAELGRIQRRGYAVDNEEVETGACCVAAPIFDSSGLIAASISVAGPVTRMGHNRIPTIAGLVTGAAARISRSLGYKEARPEHERPPRSRKARRA
ncbi:MAG TPA: IclR family transcriptional regulator [Acidobacteriaceae bacterium]|nr:IclR family transcriptional regulator [Acidobacteriaceae bacterium]